MTSVTLSCHGSAPLHWAQVRLQALAKFCFCKNNKRTIDRYPLHPCMDPRERECCLLVLNLVSSTLPCIRLLIAVVRPLDRATPSPLRALIGEAELSPHSCSSHQRVMRGGNGVQNRQVTVGVGGRDGLAHVCATEQNTTSCVYSRCWWLRAPLDD